MDQGEIDTAKMQVQGQLAAQYIQDVMQARPTAPDHQRARALLQGSPTMHLRACPRHSTRSSLAPHNAIDRASFVCPTESDRQMLLQVRDAARPEAR